MNGNIYLVATPIGNLQDITLRALDVLKHTEYIFCEDTRETKKLLMNYEIFDKKLYTLTDYNEVKRIALIEKILSGSNDIAIVSDRGTPLISDPGYKTIKTLSLKNINIIPIPGPVAFVNALIASGLPTDNFVFLGFIKCKSKDVEQYKKLSSTLIFYESPNRIEKLVKFLYKELGDRDVVIARELTKKYETFYRDRLSSILTNLDIIKGEFVVMVGGYEAADINVEIIYREIDKLISAGTSKKEVEKKISSEYNIKKSLIYNYIHKGE